MDSLLFLLAAGALIVLGTLVIVLRSREPQGHDSGIKQFQREMRALSPESRQTLFERSGVKPVARRGEDEE